MKDILLKRIYNIIQELRENGIQLSPNEIISAINSLKKEPIYDITYLRTILKINLIKDQINYLLFDVIFERFFPEFFDDQPRELENIEEKKVEYDKQIKEIQQEQIKQRIILEEERNKEIKKLKELKKEVETQNKEKVKDLKKNILDIKENINKRKDILQQLKTKEKKLKEEKENLRDKKKAIEDVMDYLDRKKEQVTRKQEILEKQEEELNNIKKKEEIEETEEKLGTEEITKTSSKPTPTERQKHGGKHRREESSKGVTPSPKPGVGKAGSGKKGIGKGEGGKGGEGEPSKSARIPRRPNTNINNNKILKSLDKTYSQKVVNTIMRNLFNNNLEDLKDQLIQYYSPEIQADKNFVKKQFTKKINEIKNIIINFDESTQEKKEIFNELLNRIKKITDYNYKKEILKQKLLEQYTLKKENINDLHFKDLQYIENNNISQYKRLMSQLNIYVKRLASTFKKKRSVRFKRAKKGKLDLKETINYNLSRYGNKVVELKYRKPKLKKANLFILCDVSGSVNHISQLFLMFMRSVATSFNKMIMYIFVDEIRQIKNISDYYKAYSEIGMRYSNMRLAYHQVNKLKIPYDFVMIILTDCRTNQFDDYYSGEIPYSYQSLKMIKNNIDDVIVLNPEPKEEWGSGGGGPSAYKYIEYSKVPVFEFYNLETFRKVVTYLEKEYIYI